ncbi:uncharacterized protein N7503_011080 [Penicillium pulvis]|uniref:uncharacterized protein n=1 Tax=Penicillium pulvis TaxID=1562058 RepID=UPI0025499C38|nr:uncharacterized protein N7503_011080 [Penicillium pulvis]KAJ5785868.1 hypothetical protein N7503_011080 [Penicillium pulvis]
MWTAAALPATKNSIFMLSATHRGDMYQVRAAMIAQVRVDKKVARYLYLHDCPYVPNDLIEYLKAIAQKLRMPYFLVSYGRETLQASARPPRDGRCILGVPQEKAGFKETILDLNNDGSLTFQNISFITEGYATLRMADIVSTDESRAIWNAVKANMTIVQGSEDVLHQMFENSNTHLFGQWPKPNSDQRTILVLHRDSGKGKDGPYPEYDTGEALAQIIFFFSSSLPNITLRTILYCFHFLSHIFPVTSGQVVSTPNIGQYWTRLGTVHGVTKRDIEAYFLKWAYEQGWYHMVVGFRSGGLDLFTLMGIPTISIGIRFLVGEDRHELLATQLFRRLNVQYDMPRHQLTAWIQGRPIKRKFSTDPVTFEPDYIHSPYWMAPPPDNLLFPPQPAKPASADAEIALRRVDTAPFTEFDKWTFEAGLRVACERNFDGWGTTIAFMTPFNGCVMTTLKAQAACPVGHSLEAEPLTEFIGEQRRIQARTWERMMQLRQQLQLNDVDFMRYTEGARGVWISLENIISGSGLQ